MHQIKKKDLRCGQLLGGLELGISWNCKIIGFKAVFETVE